MPRIDPKLAKGTAGAVALILSAVFAAEGGFVDHPNDPGGATNHGITEKVARGKGFTGSMRDLPKWMAQQWLVADYIEKPGFMRLVVIEPAVAEEVIDTAVNMGPQRPTKFLQQALNELAGAKLAGDGVMGKATVLAFADYQYRWGPTGCKRLLDALDAKQLAEYQRLVRVNPKLKVFYKGWVNKRIGNVSRAKCAP